MSLPSSLSIFLACLLAVLGAGCEDSSKPKLDHDLTASLRNLPSPNGRIAEIRIYETIGADFLSASELAALKPFQVLNTKAEIDGFFETMAQGRTSTQDATLKNFHYLPKCYHIIGVSVGKTKYGYLKIQISSDANRPMVARVQMADGTNSYEIVTLLPAVLEGMSKHKP